MTWVDMYKIVLLIIGFFVLLKSAGLLVDGAKSLARKLNVSDLVIGLTVIAFGTSLPELSVNIIASINGNTDIAIGNVLGSNIANILLILGISAIIFPLSVTKGMVWKEIPLALVAAVLVGLMINDTWMVSSDISSLTRVDGIILLAFFAAFLYYISRMAGESKDVICGDTPKESGFTRIFLTIVAGLIGVWIGSIWVVEGAVYVATVLGLSQSFIGLTIVALGTSLPELATSAVAAFKKNPDIAVGNIVGSNIFNIFFILGISSLIRPLPFFPGINADIGVVIFASLLLFFSMFTGKKRMIDRWEGAVFLIFYMCYMGFLFKRG